jgi:hypothetical protein
MTIGYFLLAGYRRSAMVLVSGLAALAALAASPVAEVIHHFHLSAGVAAEIIALIVSGSILIDFLFPYIIPAIGVIQGIIAAAGVGAATAW